MLRIGDIVSFGSAEDYVVHRGGIRRSDLLQLVNGGTMWQDLRLLVADRAEVTRLRVSGLIHAFKGLEQLCELVELDLEDYAPSPVRDFSPLQQLTVCKMGWYPKLDAAAFFSLPRLSEVSLLRYRAQDFSSIGLAKRLKVLRLRWGHVKSLRGIEGCSHLEELRLTHLRGLESLEGIESCNDLRVLELESRGPLRDVHLTLGRCRGLKEVLLEGTFELPDLGWIALNPALERFRSDVAVLNVDWQSAFSAPALHELAFRYQPNSLQDDSSILAAGECAGRRIAWLEHGGTKGAPWIEVHFRD